MNETVLKPCPFCGGKASIKAISRKDIGFTMWCECEKCNAKTGYHCPDIEKEDNYLEIINNARVNVVKKWNNRI